MAVFLLIFCFSFLEGEEAMKKMELKNLSARGVYWPWERTKYVAQNSGMEFWKFVEETLKKLKEDFHCNVVWFVNIGMEDAVKVCDVAGKYEIMVLPNINPFLNLAYYGVKSDESIKQAARDTYKLLGSKKSLGAYVLVDEPRRVMTRQMEIFRREMKKVDVERDCLVVTMNCDTQSYAHQTNFPVLCVDIYPFGGDRSPNIPNPAAASQLYYRNTLTALFQEAVKNGKHLWVMPGVFAENWGPWWYDENMNVVIEPGTYRHWRMPTVEETRWQIWEGVRSGCQGIVFYVFLPAVNDWDGKGEIPEKMAKVSADVKEKKWPVTDKQIKTGMAEALLYKNGTPTPQMKEIGRVFEVLSRWEKMFISWKKAEFPVVFTEDTFCTATFVSPEQEAKRLVVVVNDNLKEKKEKELIFLPHVSKVADLVSGKEIALKKENGFLKTFLTLQPGSGTILQVEFQQQQPGFVVFDEDFSLATLGVKLNHLVRKPVRRGFGTGWDWVVEKEKDSPPDARGVVTLENISRPFPSLTAGFSVSPAGQFEVYLFLEGNFQKPESVIVEWSGNDGKQGWLMSNNYHLPVKIFPGIKDIRINLSDGVSLNRIRCWAIPKGN